MENLKFLDFLLTLLRKVKNIVEEKRLLKKWNQLPLGNLADVNPLYVLTWDALGIQPKGDVLCPFCKVSMLVRNTQLDWSFELDDVNLHIDLRLKCPNCDLWETFGVPVPRRYFMFIWMLRKRLGLKRTYAPSQEWSSDVDDERVKGRLEAWGYF